MEKDPPLYGTVDWLYHAVMDHTPKWLQKRDMASAFILGGVGTFLVVRGAQLAVENLSPAFYRQGFASVETVVEAALLAAPVVYAALKPDQTREIVSSHPTYTAGVGACFLSAITTVGYDLASRLPPY